MFIEQLKDSIEEKIKAGWVREVSSGFIESDVVEVFDYRPYSGTFRLLTISDVRKSDAFLASFSFDQDEPTVLNLRESEELFKWARNNPGKIKATLMKSEELEN